MAIKPVQVTAAPKTAALIKLTEKALKALDKVDAALKGVHEITTTMPAVFRKDIHAGNISNIDTPAEYNLWVNLENIKSTYELTKALRETRRQMEGYKRILGEYKK